MEDEMTGHITEDYREILKNLILRKTSSDTLLAVLGAIPPCPSACVPLTPFRTQVNSINNRTGRGEKVISIDENIEVCPICGALLSTLSSGITHCTKCHWVRENKNNTSILRDKEASLKPFQTHGSVQYEGKLYSSLYSFCLKEHIKYHGMPTALDAVEMSLDAKTKESLPYRFVVTDNNGNRVHNNSNVRRQIMDESENIVNSFKIVKITR
jgi:hypothetical protein